MRFMDNPAQLNIGGEENNLSEPLLAVIVATVKEGNVTLSEEYALKPSGVEDLASQFEGWAKYEVKPMYDDEGNVIGKGYCKSDACASKCTTSNGCISVSNPAGDTGDGEGTSTEFMGAYIYETTVSSQPCGSGYNGRLDIIKVGSVNGVYEREDGVCCPKPQIQDSSDINKCVCPGKDAMVIEPGYGYIDDTAKGCKVKCEAGQYSKDKLCVLCEINHQCPSDGMSISLDCQAGYICPNNPATKDDNNKYHGDKFDENDDPIADGGLINQIICPKGTYQPDTNAAECKQCPPGTWTDGPGAIVCTSCPAGQYFKTSEKKCVPCDAGYYCPTSGMTDDPDYPELNPKECEKGHYCPDEGMITPTPCPAGTYQNQKKQLDCDPCGCGYYNPKTGQEQCLSCGNKYNPTQNATSEFTCGTLHGDDYVSQDDKCCYVHFYITYEDDESECNTENGIKTCTTKYKAVKNTQLVCPGDTPKNDDSEPKSETTTECVLTCTNEFEVLNENNCVCDCIEGYIRNDEGTCVYPETPINEEPCEAGQYREKMFSIPEGAVVLAGTSSSSARIVDNDKITINKGTGNQINNVSNFNYYYYKPEVTKNNQALTTLYIEVPGKLTSKTTCSNTKASLLGCPSEYLATTYTCNGVTTNTACYKDENTKVCCRRLDKADITDADGKLTGLPANAVIYSGTGKTAVIIPNENITFNTDKNEKPTNCNYSYIPKEIKSNVSLYKEIPGEVKTVTTKNCQNTGVGFSTWQKCTSSTSYKCDNGSVCYKDKDTRVCCEKLGTNNMDSWHAGECKTCPCGTYCEDGLDITKCPSGTYNPKSGSKDKKACRNDVGCYYISENQCGTYAPPCPDMMWGDGGSDCHCPTGEMAKIYINGATASDYTEKTTQSMSFSNNCGSWNCSITTYNQDDPVILDLLENGIKLTDIENGVKFDIDADGQLEQTSWTDVQTEFDDAFLCLDKNGNGKIDDGSELFGDQQGADTGLDELAKYDDNGDGIVNKDDKIYSKLLLWVDFNKNGISEENELRPLQQEKISEISTMYQTKVDEEGNILTDIFGNQIGIKGTFKKILDTGEEVVGTIVDAFFKTVKIVEDFVENIIDTIVDALS